MNYVRFNWVLLGVVVGVLSFSAIKSYGKTPYYICTPEDIGTYIKLVQDGVLDSSEIEIVQDPNCIPKQTQADKSVALFATTDYVAPNCSTRKIIDKSSMAKKSGTYFFAEAGHFPADPKKEYETHVNLIERQTDGTEDVAYTGIYILEKCGIQGMKAFALFAKGENIALNNNRNPHLLTMTSLQDKIVVINDKISLEEKKITEDHARLLKEKEELVIELAKNIIILQDMEHKDLGKFITHQPYFVTKEQKEEARKRERREALQKKLVSK